MSKVNKKLERLETLVNFIIDVVYPKYAYRVVFGPNGIKSSQNVLVLGEYTTHGKAPYRRIRLVINGTINDIACKSDLDVGTKGGVFEGSMIGNHIGVSTLGKVISEPIAVMAKD